MLLKVSDIERSERFYVDLLGFKIRPAKPLADGRPFVPFTQGLALTRAAPRTRRRSITSRSRRRTCAPSRRG